jgi:hypothetical protein
MALNDLPASVRLFEELRRLAPNVTQTAEFSGVPLMHASSWCRRQENRTNCRAIRQSVSTSWNLARAPPHQASCWENAHTASSCSFQLFR